ncbi:unnamed protein product [Absidia cylindrospora]
MSSVQAVIAALNQQSTNNDVRQTSNRQSKAGPDIASLRNRFGSTTDAPTHRSSHIEQKTIKETSCSLNRSASSISSFKKNTPAPPTSHKSDQLASSSYLNRTKYAKFSHQSLVEQLEKMTTERDQLKQQLSGQNTTTIDTTPYSSACGSPNMAIPTSSPLDYSSSLLFDMNEIDNGNQPTDYEDIITNYNCQQATYGQQKRQIANLQRQLAACEIGTQWMMNKYLGELEQERLCTKSLGTIIQNQEDLIQAMETNKTNGRRPSSLPTPSSSSSLSIGKATYQQQHQQTLLLHSQLELQRLELDDKQEVITLLANERDVLVKKMKQLVDGQHARLASMPSTGSLSTMSSATSSCLDWVTVNSMPKCLNKPYSPPQTPPPRESLPPLPSTTIITPDMSPRSTLVISPSPPFDASTTTTTTTSSSSSLGHKSSMPDLRTLHEHHIHHHHHHRYDSADSMGSGVTRQRSFWKGWKQRLTN